MLVFAFLAIAVIVALLYFLGTPKAKADAKQVVADVESDASKDAQAAEAAVSQGVSAVVTDASKAL